MKTRILACLALIGGFSDFASASRESAQMDRRESVQIDRRESALSGLRASGGSRFSTAKAALSVEHFSYVRSGQEYFGGDEKAGQMSTAGMSLSFDHRRGRRHSQIDLHAFHSFAEEHSYADIRDLYTDYTVRDSRIAFGRMRTNFSEADEFWETGQWQPRFMWDPMQPDTNGLFGLFGLGSANNGSTRLTVFASPIYVPEETQAYREKNGKVYSKNPWFRPPPPVGEILGDTTDIHSYVDEPKVTDVISQPSFAMRAEQDLGENVNVGLSYGVKPVNQTLLKFKYKMVTANGEQYARINFAPHYAYHHLVTSDATFRAGRWKTLISNTYEKPFKLEEDQVLISQQLREMYVASMMTSFDLLGEGASATQLYAGVIKAWGATAPDGGEDLSGESLFDIRQRWLEAYRLGVRHPVWTKLRRLYNNLEFTYDRMQNGATVISQIEYNVASGWIATASVDLLGVFDTRESEYEKAFVRQYRANDRFAMGLSYVY